MGNYAGQQIVITYKAKVLETAVKTTAGNPNTATLEYSNKILPTNRPKKYQIHQKILMRNQQRIKSKIVQ